MNDFLLLKIDEQGNVDETTQVTPLSKGDVDELRIKNPEHDVFFLPVKNRKKKLFLADMDSTIVASETVDELAVYANVGEEVAKITAQSMAGDIDFDESLTKRVALLEGLSVDVMDKVLEQTKINEGAVDMVRAMSKAGVHCVLISGGFTFFTEKVASIVGFHDHHGNVLEIMNGKLTGKLAGSILGPESKLNIMNEYINKLNITSDDVIATGDGANDRFMLESAGLGIGYHPKPKLKNTLMNYIERTSFLSLLKIQGYET